jgi:arginase family enzyme
LTLDELETALEKIAGRFTIASGALTAYDPGFDRDGRALEACKRILARLAAVAEAPG